MIDETKLKRKRLRDARMDDEAETGDEKDGGMV